MSLLASISNNLKFWNFKDDNLLLSSSVDFTDNGNLSSKSSLLSSHASSVELLTVSWNHNQQVVAVGGSDQKLYLVQGSSGQILSSLPLDENDQFRGIVRSLSFSHNSRYLASAIDNDIAIWDLKKRNMRVKLSGQKSVVNAVQFTNDGSVVSGDNSGAVLIWNVERNTHSKELLNAGFRNAITCLRLSPSNNKHICCGYNDGSITVWDSNTLTSLNRCSSAHRSAISSIAYSPKNDRLVATGGKDGQLNLVDLGSRHDKFSPAVTLHVGDQISALSFHDSALYTAVGTESGYILVYDWRNSRKPVVQLSAHNPLCVHDLAFQQTPPAKSSSKAVTSNTSDSTAGKHMAPNSGSSSSSSSVSDVSTSQTIETVSTLATATSSLPPAVTQHSSSVNDGNTLSIINTSSVNPATWLSPTSKSQYAEHNRAALTLQQQQTPPRPLPSPQALHPPATSRHLSEDLAPIPPRVTDSPTQRRDVQQPHATPDDDAAVEQHIRNQLRPVSNQELTEALQLIRYDIHREVQAVIREQVRQFSIAKDESATLITQLSEQLREVLQANKELRAENERLRRIY